MALGESSTVAYSPATPIRLLFLLPFAPRFDARHGGRTTAGLVARLAERHDAALVYLRGRDEEPVEPVLREKCTLVEEVLIRSPVPGWLRARRAWSLVRGQPIQVGDCWSRELATRARAVMENWQPDVVHLELEQMGQYLSALEDRRAARVLVAAEAAGDTAQDLFRVARGAPRLVSYLDLRAWRRFERVVLPRADTVVCYTDRDRRALASVAPGVTIETIPLRVEVPERALDPLGSQSALVFVGGFGHRPNVDAATRLATHIFPLIRARRPDAMLYLVGDKPPSSVRRLAGEQVVVTGRVGDVRPYLDRAAVIVAPLRLGGGTRVKVLEALAAGKAVVASPLAAEGVGAMDGQHLLLAESDEHVADAVVRLLLDPDERAALAMRARRWAESALDWRGAVAAYEGLYERLLGPDAHPSRFEPGP